MRFGFYDESLVLSRAIGEIANLLVLFQQDESAFKEWKNATRQHRIKEFGPSKVRIRLECLGMSSPINKERYQLLSERGAHVTAETKPQSHNILGLPLAGAMIQDEGLLVCLNELAVALAISSGFGALNLDLDNNIKIQVVTAAENLAKQIGGATITEIDEYHREIRDHPTAREHLDRLSKMMRHLQKERRRRAV